ncbi:MAG: hypothetical protein C4575_09385 [Desulforudis sp.]|jgi:hypothetical protein|nr:MAG: hypothetical protein C4575_09385 [Desulforudis sp.]
MSNGGSLLTNVASAAAGVATGGVSTLLTTALDFAKGIVDHYFPPQMTDADKAAATMEIQKMTMARDAVLTEASKSIIVAEMAQGDNYTKRARPTLIYGGLFFIFLNYVLLPAFAFFTSKAFPKLELPTEFWWAWTGACGAWIVGRTYERAVATNRVSQLLTGTKSLTWEQ